MERKKEGRTIVHACDAVDIDRMVHYGTVSHEKKRKRKKMNRRMREKEGEKKKGREFSNGSPLNPPFPSLHTYNPELEPGKVVLGTVPYMETMNDCRVSYRTVP